MFSKVSLALYYFSDVMLTHSYSYILEEMTTEYLDDNYCLTALSDRKLFILIKKNQRQSQYCDVRMPDLIKYENY